MENANDDRPEIETTAETEVEARNEKLRKRVENPNLFKPGQSGNPGGKPKAVDADESPTLTVPKQLRDMRRVYGYSAARDTTEAHRKWRKIWDDDPKSFMAQKTALERAYLQAQQSRS